MPLSQTNDFLEESETLYTLVRDLAEADFRRVTGFKGWTIDDVFVHLHVWNGFADQALNQPSDFTELFDQVAPILLNGGFRAFEDPRVSERGLDLVDVWIMRAREMASRWKAVDPKQRIPWVGPSMSTRSAMTARQMETWAHGYEVYDLLGHTRVESDRVQNIVILGINTFGWTHSVHSLPTPPLMPEVVLQSPSGQIWRYGDASAGSIRGLATDFAAVVTQVRAVADTELAVDGAVAETWMAHAQCFAGAPSQPPLPGTRFRNERP
ncbi:MAG: TIGR03084 family metal-binding protein [Pseudomonadota bacterium]